MIEVNPITLTQELIRCASVTPADNGAQEVLKKPLRDMGFEIFDLPFQGNGGSYPVKNFFARLDKNVSTGAPHICYAGHTDVVPVGNETAWKYPPFDAVIDGDTMYGRGTADMKGGNCAFVSAISHFLNNNADFKGSISLLITGDEEAESINGTKRVLEWMKDNNHIPDIALVGEPTCTAHIGDTIKIGRRGIQTGYIKVSGKQGHVAYPHLALNPIPMITKITSALDEMILDEGTEHFQASNLEFVNIDSGVGAGNVIPETATAQFNVRFNTEYSFESLQQTIKNKVNDVVKNHDYAVEVTWSKSDTDTFLTEKNETVELFAQCVTKQTKIKPEYSTGGGSSDAAYIKDYCPVFEFGLLNKTAHHIDENISISDLELLTKIYTEFLQQYFK